MKSVISLLAASVIFYASTAASHQMHSHRAPALAAPLDVGEVDFETSCTPKVARDFNRAVALLHSFAYIASEKAFGDVAATDPSCAMAYWGVAMSNYHGLWSPPDAAELARGKAAVEKATRLPVQTERERLFIAAIAAYYRDADNVPPATRAKAYEAAMAEAVKRYSTDIEIQVFHALALIATAPPEDKSYANQKRAGAILEPLYRDLPKHPGLAHYIIHAYDSVELAPRGLAAARAYAAIAPSVPHALHMPSHIFIRMGLWDEAITSNEAARKAAQDLGDAGEELHAMDYLIYAYLQRGRFDAAQDLVQALSSFDDASKRQYAATVMPIRLALESQQWDVATKLQPHPGSAPEVAGLVYWARAVGHARVGNHQAAAQDIAKLETCREQLIADGNTYWATQVEILVKEAKGWRSMAQSQLNPAIKSLKEAADQEDSIEKLSMTPGPVIPAREQLGDLFLESHRPWEALDAYKAVLAAAPGRRNAIIGADKAREAIEGMRAGSQIREPLSK